MTMLSLNPKVMGSISGRTLFCFSIYKIVKNNPEKTELSDFRLSLCFVGLVAKLRGFLVEILQVFLLCSCSYTRKLANAMYIYEPFFANLACNKSIA